MHACFMGWWARQTPAIYCLADMQAGQQIPCCWHVYTN